MELIALTVIALAVGVGFFVRAVAGFGAALIALPLLLLVLPPAHAVGLLSLYFFAFSAVMVYRHWNMLEKRVLLHIGIASLAGLLVGVFLLKWLKTSILLNLLGVFILFYLFLKYFCGKADIFARMGTVFGFVGGVFSGVYASGGSLYVTYLHNKFDDSILLRAHALGVLGIADLIRLPVFISEGVITREIIIIALIMLPILGCAMWFGEKVQSQIDQGIFDKAVACLLGVSALFLIFR